jgi:hypothetical protein
MDAIVTRLIVATIGLFTLALLVVRVRPRHAPHLQPRRAPPRRAQAGAVPESLFRSRS